MPQSLYTKRFAVANSENGRRQSAKMYYLHPKKKFGKNKEKKEKKGKKIE